LKGFPSTLEKLSINSSNIRTPVDRRIFSLKNLHTLDLSLNNIGELPTKIEMNSLHTFILRSNQLKILPKDLKCPQLKILDLSQNHFQSIDGTLLSLRTLERLNLSDNQIHYLPRHILRQLPQLQVFNITSNQIRIIPSCLAASGTRLHTFHYSENPLVIERSITCQRWDISLLEIALRTIVRHR